MTTTDIKRPKFLSIPLKDSQRWVANRDWVYQEKLDGVWHVEEISNAILIGELVKDSFTAFDVVKYQGDDVPKQPLRERLTILRSIGVPMVCEGTY